MAIPSVTSHGDYTRCAWVLTSVDFVAVPTPLLGHRSDKTIDVHGLSNAAGWNTATVQIHGTTDEEETGVFKQLYSSQDVPLVFSAASDRHHVILPNVLRLVPVITAGLLGIVGIRIVVVASSQRSRAL